jgi:hypothetical protein
MVDHLLQGSGFCVKADASFHLTPERAKFIWPVLLPDRDKHPAPPGRVRNPSRCNNDHGTLWIVRVPHEARQEKCPSMCPDP